VAEVRGDGGPGVLPRHLVQGVAHEVELAPLPGGGRPARGQRRLEPGVVVADGVPHAVHPAALQGEEELAPVRPGLRAGGRGPEDHAAAAREDADVDQDGAGQHAVADAGPLVVGVEHEVGDRPQRPLPPAGELGVEQGRRPGCPGRWSRPGRRSAP
jgi:hypothetical protein